MSDSWQKAYVELTDYISNNPEIKINSSKTEIPEEKRGEFYALFNQLRKTFVDEKFPELIEKSLALSKSYLQIEGEVIDLLELEGISASRLLDLFLHQPVERLIREQFNPLFNLLKGRVDIQTYEKDSAGKINSYSRELYINGYTKWLELNLIKMLEATKLFRVYTAKMLENDYPIMDTVEQAPLPQAMKLISFEYDPVVRFTVPDFIIYSSKINKYISARSNFKQCMLRADHLNQDREWSKINSMFSLGPEWVLIYTADNVNELSLIADANNICQPDLVVVCAEPEVLNDLKRFNEDVLINNKIKPLLGTFVVSMDNISQQTPENHIEDIHVLEVGLDAAKLRPVIEVLTDDGKENKYVQQMGTSPKKPD